MNGFDELFAALRAPFGTPRKPPRLPEARGDLWRVVCWMLGHRWHVVSVNERKASALVHLHTLAGCAAACDRCGELWDDRWPWVS